MKKIILDIETCGLESINDRIICIGIQDINEKIINSFSGEDEKIILIEFWKAIENCDEIITYCGNGFDIPFLVRRSLINNIKVSDNFRDKRIKFTDLKLVVDSFFMCYQHHHGKLHDWANVLGIKIQTENGSKMKEYYEKKEWDKIIDHCEEDILITKQLFERCLECNLVKK